MSLAKGTTKFDKATMQADLKSGMSVPDIAKKYNCSKASVYRLCGSNVASRPAKNIDWVAVQKRRDAGESSAAIIKELGTSNASFYTRTHPASGKPPVIRSRKFTQPTPSPFASATPATNGHHKLVNEINTNLRNTLKSAQTERAQLVSETALLDKMIARLERAIQ
jgi:hypothetical protein